MKGWWIYSTLKHRSHVLSVFGPHSELCLSVWTFPYKCFTDKKRANTRWAKLQQSPREGTIREWLFNSTQKCCKLNFEDVHLVQRASGFKRVELSEEQRSVHMLDTCDSWASIWKSTLPGFLHIKLFQILPNHRAASQNNEADWAEQHRCWTLRQHDGDATANKSYRYDHNSFTCIHWFSEASESTHDCFSLLILPIISLIRGWI